MSRFPFPGYPTCVASSTIHPGGRPTRKSADQTATGGFAFAWAAQLQLDRGSTAAR